ncbi:hypothetical protein DEO72_LG10g3222 [Vigna unguiculata]|uniref:Uncharacterized protein n=1 Tax=Vigna unguiculata TaxID=3917 RepID=A0A4D6NDQ3_VIGUN|nr:hypothetical protein DEO72_LG10g3222 [Vigna unguiculata]
MLGTDAPPNDTLSAARRWRLQWQLGRCVLSGRDKHWEFGMRDFRDCNQSRGWLGTLNESECLAAEMGVPGGWTGCARRSKTQKEGLQRLVLGGEVRSARRTRGSKLLFENLAPGVTLTWGYERGRFVCSVLTVERCHVRGGTRLVDHMCWTTSEQVRRAGLRARSSPFLFVYGDDRVIRYTGADVDTGGAEDVQATE